MAITEHSWNFQIEVLDWPGGTNEAPGGKQDNGNVSGGGEAPPVESETVVKAAPEQTSPETEVENEKSKDAELTSVISLLM